MYILTGDLNVPLGMVSYDLAGAVASVVEIADRIKMRSGTRFIAAMLPARIGFALVAAVASAAPWGVAATSSFDVASVKPTDPSVRPPGRLASIQVDTTPGVLTVHNANLRDLIRGAWSLEDYQVVGGPDWMLSARFDLLRERLLTAPIESHLLLMLRTLQPRPLQGRGAQRNAGTRGICVVTIATGAARSFTPSRQTKRLAGQRARARREK